MYLKSDRVERIIVHEASAYIANAGGQAGQAHCKHVAPGAISPAKDEVDDEAGAEECGKESIAGEYGIVAVDRGFDWTRFGNRVTIKWIDMIWVDSHFVAAGSSGECNAGNGTNRLSSRSPLDLWIVLQRAGCNQEGGEEGNI